MNEILYQKRWLARLVVCTIMLALAFGGMVIMNIHAKTYWIYSCAMAFAYAILSVGLFWYLNHQNKSYYITFWHQILHWLGLGIALYLTAIFIRTGLMTHMQAGLATLVLLALTVFVMGVYTDSSFMLIGLTLAIFAGGAALLQSHISILMIPVILVATLIIYIMADHERRKQKKDRLP